MAPLIIGLSGKLCSGKDATVSALIATHGGVRVAFADKLKEIVSDLFGVDAWAKDNHTRRLLQDVGVALRSVQEDVWVAYALRYAQDIVQVEQKDVYVSDVRFPNEVAGVERAGGYVIRVHCDEPVRQERIAALYPDTDPIRFTHISETALDTHRFLYDIDSTTPATLARDAVLVWNAIQVAYRGRAA